MSVAMGLNNGQTCYFITKVKKAEMENKKAAVLSEINGPLVIKDVKYTKPKSREIIIKVEAIAVSSIDKMHKSGVRINGEEQVPSILGKDIAGEVYEVGERVKKFKKGDRVIACCEHGFQEYAKAKQDVTCVIPDNMQFKDAVVMPLAISAAAVGLYSPGYLELELPQLVFEDYTNQVVLIWGGTTSIGCQAIQLATASGYSVATTTSNLKDHTEYLKDLGADEVYDTSVMTVTMNVEQGLKKYEKFAGAINCLGTERSHRDCCEIVQRMRHHGNEFVSICDLNGTKETVNGRVVLGDLHKSPLAKEIFGKFLPKALKQQVIEPAPPATVVGKGLGNLNKAMELQLEAKCQKFVVTL